MNFLEACGILSLTPAERELVARIENSALSFEDAPADWQQNPTPSEIDEMDRLDQMKRKGCHEI